MVNQKQSGKKKITPSIHYASYGEWGGARVNCGRYYTTDVAHTGDISKVTCKFCNRLFKPVTDNPTNNPNKPN